MERQFTPVTHVPQHVLDDSVTGHTARDHDVSFPFGEDFVLIAVENCPVETSSETPTDGIEKGRAEMRSGRNYVS